MTLDCSFNWPDVGRVTGPCIRPGGPVLTARALDACGLAPGSLVGDIGCGAGGTLEYLEAAGLQGVGLDCSGALLGEAASRCAAGRLVNGRAEALPFRDASFDALFCECVLSVVARKETALAEYARVLKRGGRLVISDVFAPGGSGPGQPDGDGFIDKEWLTGLLTGLGFSVILWEEYERQLKEFAARMIFAGACLPGAWRCGQRLSYFLLAAVKGHGRTATP